jgi:hypothetical protein
MEPIRLEIFLDDKTLAGIHSVEGNLTGVESITKAMVARLKDELADLQKRYKELRGQGLVSDKELADIQALKGVISGLKDELRDLDKAKRTTSQTPVIDTDATARQTNALKFQFTQVARELPSLSMGPVMFITAISNNLPMLADSIKQVRVQNELLAQSGQKGVPIWKQLLSAGGSWQTMLVVGITLLMVYYKDIMAWVGGLGKAKDMTIQLTSAENELAASRKKAIDGVREELVQLNILYSRLKSASTSTKERTAAAAEWVKRYPQYASVLSGERADLGKLETAYRSLTTEIKANAVAKSYANKIGELAVKRDDENIKKLNQQVTLSKARTAYDKAQREYKEWQDRYDKGESVGQVLPTYRVAYFDAQDNLKKQKKIYDDLSANVQKYDDKIKAMEDHVKASELFPQPKEGTYDYWQAQRDRADATLKQIRSDVKATLDKASKENKDLSALGIDPTTVATYKQAVERLKEAQKQLKAYEDPDKGKKGGTKKDYATELEEARLRSQQKLEAARVEAMADGYDKRKEIARKEYDESVASIDKREKEELKLIAEARKKGAKVPDGAEGQARKDAQQQRVYAMFEYTKATTLIDKDRQEKERQAWVDYNKQYGTYMQKRQAIAEEYASKIAKAETDGEKETLKRQMEEALAGLDFTNLKKGINWEMVFGDLSKETKKQLQDVRRQLQAFKSSPEFKRNATPEQMKVVENAMDAINGALVDKGGIFGGMKDSLADLKKSAEELAEAEKELTEANKSGTDAQKEEAQAKVNNAQAKLQNSQTNVKKSADATTAHLEAVGDAMSALGDKTQMSLSNIGDVVSTLVAAFSDSGSKIAGIIASIFAILDGIQKEGLDGFVGNILGHVGNAIGGILQTFWGWTGIKFGGADYEDYDKAKKNYEDYADVLDTLIDKQKELIETMTGKAALDASKQALTWIDTEVEGLRQLGKERMNSGASIGSHSIGMRMWKAMNGNDLVGVQEALGDNYRDILGGRMEGLFDLTSEQLDNLKHDAPTFWAKLDGDAQEYLQNIIDSAQKTQDIIDATDQKFTQTSFDDVRSNFKDALTDMESSSADFASSFQKMMAEAVINSMMVDNYDARIKAWYEKFSQYSQSDYKLTKDEISQLQSDYDSIVSDALKERDNLASTLHLTGSSSSQSGQSGAYTALSQEQGTKLEGLFTSLQDHASGIHTLVDELKRGQDGDHEVFGQIAENTSYCKLIEQVLEIMRNNDVNGQRVKVIG